MPQPRSERAWASLLGTESPGQPARKSARALRSAASPARPSPWAWPSASVRERQSESPSPRRIRSRRPPAWPLQADERTPCHHSRFVDTGATKATGIQGGPNHEVPRTPPSTREPHARTRRCPTLDRHDPGCRDSARRTSIPYSSSRVGRASRGPTRVRMPNGILAGAPRLVEQWGPLMSGTLLGRG